MLNLHQQSLQKSIQIQCYNPTETMQVASLDSLPPTDTIATVDVKSISLSQAEPTSVTSNQNVPKIKYVTPQSIDINDPKLHHKLLCKHQLNHAQNIKIHYHQKIQSQSRMLNQPVYTQQNQHLSHQIQLILMIGI